MSYTTMGFLFFVAALFIVYYIMPSKLRWIVLLIGNVIFYVASGWDNFVFLLASILISYFVGVKMSNLQDEFKDIKKSGTYDRQELKDIKAGYTKRRRRYLQAGLVGVIGILVVVKYTNFLLGNVHSLLDALGFANERITVKMIIPLGISFYTFQTIAYLVDVYNGMTAQKNIFKYALYSSFFPSVVQGPIPRYSELGTQLFEEHKFNGSNVVDGLTLILWGLVKKLVLAEKLALFVSEIYDNYASYDGVILVLATVLYSIQIYADFAGCMDIVTGVARLFDIRLKPNFIRPYFSKTMPEFWRRWHASLGTWFKDYVFYPFSISNVSLKLNKNARKTFGNAAGRIIAASMPILIVWALTGIWHGAEWKYVIWGLFHGTLIILSTIFTPSNEKLADKLKINRNNFLFQLFQMGRTFALCCVGRVFFRADNFGHAIGVFRQMFAKTGVWRLLDGRIYTYGLDKRSWFIVGMAMLAILIVSILEERKKADNIADVTSDKPAIIRGAVLYVLLFAVVVFASYGKGYDPADFIYEQF